MICCENVVKILWMQHFFLIPPQISATIIFFFLPFSAMPLPQLLKKKFYFPISAMALPQLGAHNFFFSPYFGNGIATISLSIFFFSFHFGHSTHTSSKIGHRKFGIPVAEIQHFLSPPFSSSLLYFWLNFSNGNTEIQSLSSKSQIALNSSYNAN